jgi:Gnt-I system high-affinity gluconate transporter/Gnt-II system L-idonate transporter
MPLVLLGIAIALLLVLIVRLKLNAFLALLVTSFLAGVLNGMRPEAALQSILKGIGDTMGSLVLVLVFGAMLGKLIEESGAAHTISYALTGLLGESRIQIAMLATGFIVGLPMIYNASFLVLIPLIYTLSGTTGLPLMYLGIPLSAALSVMHGYIPPHPAPTSIAILYKADVNRTLLYGLVLAVPAAVLAGPVLARFFRKLKNQPPPDLYHPLVFRKEALPGLGVSLMVTLIPVLLMLGGAVVSLAAPAGGNAVAIARFLSDPNVALLAAVLAGLYALGLRRGRNMDALMKSVAAAAASVAMVILIIASGGAFKQVLLDCGTGEVIKAIAARAQVSPILLAWGTAALLRLALGSATVAAITAAGIIIPLVPNCGVAPELLVIATTSGSLMFSHFNDIGFWMFKEYYNVTVKQTFQIWTVMESIVAVVGLAGVFLLHAALGSAVAAAAPKRVFYVNSYHQGYPSSDDVMAAIREILGREGVIVEVAFLDAKRRPAETDVGRRAEEALEAIRRFRPDLVIASDDDAVKYVVAPHFRDGPVPAVFCGVNWSARQYGLPTDHVTGMLVVVPIEETLREVRQARPGIRHLRVLSEDSVSERSNRELLDPKYRALGLEPSYALVTEFEEWRRAFAAAQYEADMVYLPTNGAIRGWDARAAVDWVESKIWKPVVTCDDFMMPYAVYGLTKVAREQGEWAARAALEILRGKRPGAIPVVSNHETRCYFNPDLAGRIGFPGPRDHACAVLQRRSRFGLIRLLTPIYFN